MTESEINQFVIKRGGYRCEYCCEPLAGRGFQIEHITPRNSGGIDSIDNYAAACPDCNSRKGPETTGLDPIWRTTQRLFNPRTDSHADHFFKHGTTWTGKTPIGRATATVLFRATPQLIPADLFWPVLRPLKLSHEELYWKMNTLRARANRNDFSLLDEVLSTDMWFKAASYDGKVNAREAMTLLKLELRMLRAAPKDIDTGIKTIRRLRRAAAIRPTLAGELYSIESIFLKQRATAIALQGNVARSRQLQRIASAQLLEAIRLRNEDIDSDEFSSRRYRLMALESRFSKYGKPALSLNDVKAAVSRAAWSLSSSSCWRHQRPAA